MQTFTGPLLRGSAGKHPRAFAGFQTFVLWRHGAISQSQVFLCANSNQNGSGSGIRCLPWRWEYNLETSPVGSCLLRWCTAEPVILPVNLGGHQHPPTMGTPGTTTMHHDHRGDMLTSHGCGASLVPPASGCSPNDQGLRDVEYPPTFDESIQAGAGSWWN